ncbi:unnamed protein product [Schistosoma mattheei]|uniref:Uncharacterized protein n=1 Tax=Schistosoma mattheei TaxID=31246 RepID=A0A183Q6P2_9TREM|nr:unnamed protein product [Schistosoma mattheei]
MIRLQEYDFSKGHVPGKENVMVGYLSRPDTEAALPLTAYAVNSIKGDPLEHVRQQKADSKLQEVNLTERELVINFITESLQPVFVQGELQNYQVDLVEQFTQYNYD